MSEKVSAKLTPYTVPAVISCLIAVFLNICIDDQSVKTGLMQISPAIGSVIGYALVYILAWAGVVSLEKRRMITALNKKLKFLEKQLKSLKSQDSYNPKHTKELEQQIQLTRIAIAKSYEIDDSKTEKDTSPNAIQ